MKFVMGSSGRYTLLTYAENPYLSSTYCVTAPLSPRPNAAHT
jgi:hypothetical protein